MTTMIGQQMPDGNIVYDGFMQHLKEGDKWWEMKLFYASLHGIAAKNTPTANTLANVRGDLLFMWDDGRKVKEHFDRKGIKIQREFRDQDGGYPRIYVLREAAGMLAAYIDPEFCEYIFTRAYAANPDETRRRALGVLGQPDPGPVPGVVERVTVDSIRRNEDRERLEALRWTLDQGLADLTSRVTKISVDLPRMTHELGDVPALLRSTVTLLHEVVQGQVRIYDQFIRVQPGLIDGLSQNASKMAALILLQVAQGQPRAIQQTLDLG